jgi:AraC family transcriptional regulator, arabinose operon regulatory protein
VMPDHCYVPDEVSQIYTSPCISAHVPTPFDVLIAFTACRQPFILQVGEHVAQGSALAAAARDRALHAKGVRLVILQITPFHPAYRLFRGLRTVLCMDREKYARFDTHFNEAYLGTLSLAGAQELSRGVVEQITQELPNAPPLDARVKEVMRLLFDNPRLPLDELAAHGGVSYDRMSHLFIDQLGISIRSFQVWVKLRRALTGIRIGQSLIELAERAGFSDAAHLSRVYKQVYGAPPSYFYYSGNVKLVASFAGPIPGMPEMKAPAAVSKEYRISA